MVFLFCFVSVNDSFVLLLPERDYIRKSVFVHCCKSSPLFYLDEEIKVIHLVKTLMYIGNI